MAFFSVAATIVSGWAVVLVRRTWHETKRTADAAVQANSTARDIGEKQLRAYVFGEVEKFAVRDQGELVGIRLRPAWKNLGNTPAYDFRVRTTVGIRADDLPQQFDFSEILPTSHNAFNLGPGDRSRSDIHSLSSEELAGIKNGTMHCFVVGKANYRDVFDGTPERETRYCFKLLYVPDNIDVPYELFSFGGAIGNFST